MNEHEIGELSNRFIFEDTEIGLKQKMTKTFFTDYAIQISEIAGKREVKLDIKVLMK